MSRRFDDPRIARKPIRAEKRLYHVVDLTGSDDADDQVCTWLKESYMEFG